MLSSKKPGLMETNRRKIFYNKMFQNFLSNKNSNLYSRNSSCGVVFAERFNRTIRDLPKRPVFGKRESNWIDVLPTIKKQYNNRVHSLTKLTPIQASLKKNEGYFYNNLLHKRTKIYPKFQVNDLFRTADLKETFSKADTTNWSYKFYKITEITTETIPTYRTDELGERYNESLLKKTESTLKENKEVMKKEI